MRRLLVCSALVLVSLVTLPASISSAATRADGLAPCSAGPAPFAWHGACATYNGNNTFYGLHGLGFPTPLGWGLCAYRASHGGGYPAPGYQYTLTSAPSGANLSRSNALGWAFSDAQRQGWWTAGSAGSFTADQVAIAAKLLYDNVVWGTALPTVDAGVQRALNQLRALMTAATGISAPPSLALALQGGGTTLMTTGTLVATLSAAGVTGGLAGVPITLTLSGATFTSNHASTLTLTTDSSGRVLAPFATTSATPSTVVATASAVVAQPGLLFYGPTVIVPTAQILATPRAPVSTSQRLTLTSTGAPTGTVQVQKIGDDPTYVPVADAVFQVFDGSNNVVATLTTDSSGLTPVSDPLPVGSYTLHEAIAPPGYDPAQDQSFAITANTLTSLTVTAAEGDAVQRAGVTIVKRDAASGAELAGATFSLTYDPNNTHTASGAVLTCTTDAAGACGWSDLLPGNYLLAEVSPPPNYAPSHLREWIYVGPAETHTYTYDDTPLYVTLDAHKFNATTDEVIANATYDLYVKDPGPPGEPPVPPTDTPSFVGLTFMARGTTDSAGHLRFTVRSGYAWCLREVSVPPPYILDPDLHCTGVLVASARTASLALPEVASEIDLGVRKFNAASPSVGIPGAYYALFVKNPVPPGYAPPPAPTNITVPAGTTLWAVDATDAAGHLNFRVPRGSAWCVRELTAPAGYKLDTALHCTGVVTDSSPASDLEIAVPELAYTGVSLHILWYAGALVAAGLVLVVTSRRRRPTSR